MIQLPAGIKPCSLCTKRSAITGFLVTMGCQRCNHSGRANLWHLVGDHKGDYYHCRLWIGGQQTGNWIFHEEDWIDFKAQHADNPAWVIEEYIP